MDNLPMIQDKLNIFQKLRISLYLMRKYSYSRFNNAPEYVKQDEKVLRKMIRGEQSISPSHNEKLIELFKSNPSLFDAESKNKVVEYALKNHRYDIIIGLTDDEQFDIITKAEEQRPSSYFSEKMWPYIKSEVVLKIISEERCAGFRLQNWSYEPSFLRYCSSDIQLKIISQNKDFLHLASDDVLASYLTDHEADISLLNDEDKKRFLHGNISFLDKHPEYVRVADRETQLSLVKQNKNNLKYISEELQIKILEQHPLAFEFLESKLKKELFNVSESQRDFYKEPFNIINELLSQDIKYFKFVSYDKNRDITREYLKYFLAEQSNLDIKTIKEYFIKSGLLSAKGNLRTHSSSYYLGNERVDGQDIYSGEQLDIIRQLDTKTICELINIDVNYIMPYATQRNLLYRNAN